MSFLSKFPHISLISLLMMAMLVLGVYIYIRRRFRIRNQLLEGREAQMTGLILFTPFLATIFMTSLIVLLNENGFIPQGALVGLVSFFESIFVGGGLAAAILYGWAQAADISNRQ